MIDDENLPILGLTGAGAALLWKLIGPTTEYVGQRLREIVKAGDENLQRVIKRAIEKASTDEVGSIPPRVLKDVFEEAPFYDDELSAEYLSGILASSRSPLGRDDVGIAMLALVKHLATSTLRLHFLLYRAAVELLPPTDRNAREAGNRLVFMANDVVSPVIRMELPDPASKSADELAAYRNELTVRMVHAVMSLERDGLIRKIWMGANDSIAKEYDVAKDAFITTPSDHGWELFKWCLGQGMARDLDYEQLLSSLEHTDLPRLTEVRLLGTMRKD